MKKVKRASHKPKKLRKKNYKRHKKAETKRKKIKRHVVKAVRQKNERVPTWIKNFDKLIGGGFTKNSTNLIIGGSGSGKSIFATQFLVEAMRKGEKCLYVTFEENKAQFYDNMKSLGWDLDDYEKKGLFVFLE